MAENEDKEDGGEIAKLEKAIKTNRTMFFSLLVCAAVIISILITSVLVINLQLSNRREVPAEEFAELLAELETNLTHLNAIHNSEAQVYFAFQDSLTEIKELYQHEKINDLRQLLIEREKDNRKLMDLMAEGASSLANMAPGSREWTKTYSQKVQAQKVASQEREAAIIESTKEEVEEEPEQDEAEGDK